MFGPLIIRSVHLPYIRDTSQADALFDVYCEGGKIKDIRLARPDLVKKPFWYPSRLDLWKFPEEIDAGGKGVLLPS